MYVLYFDCTCKAFSTISGQKTYIGGITLFLLPCLRNAIACIGFHLLWLRRNDMMLNLVSCYGIYYCLIVQSPYIYTVFILTFILGREHSTISKTERGQADIWGSEIIIFVSLEGNWRTCIVCPPGLLEWHWWTNH